MKRFVACVLLLLLAGPAAAEDAALYDGHLQFAVPQGFRAATEAEIMTKYPHPQRPDHVYTVNDQLAVMIAVRRTPLPPTVTQPIGEIGAMVAERQIGVQPGITMHRHNPATINGREWYAIEFASPSPEGQVENMIRLTIADGFLIVFSGNSTAAQFGQYEAPLRAAIESVVVR
jgi:hypothetical protein